MTDTVEPISDRDLGLLLETLTIPVSQVQFDQQWAFTAIKKLASRIRGQDAEIERLREALKRISCPTQTDNLYWWQQEARAALPPQEGE